MQSNINTVFTEMDFPDFNSGNEKIGWIMYVKNVKNVVNRFCFESSAINICPKEYISSDDEIQSIEFEACAINELPTSLVTSPHQYTDCKIDAIYTFDGKKSSHHTKYPYIIHYTDGHSEKAWKR